MLKSFFIAALLSFALAGCGGGAKVAAGPQAPIGVYTSASDCAESEKLDLAGCEKLIEAAIAGHHQNAKTYISMRQCEAAEGVDHCERTDENKFRPRLQAFLVTFSAPPAAEALYAGSDGTQAEFETINKGRKVLAADETLLISKNARMIAESNTKRR